MTSWAGAAGAGAAANNLQQILENRLMQAKQAEMERSARAQEAQQQAEMAQRAEQFRASQQMQLTNLSDNRDDRYQDRTQHVNELNLRTQRQSTEDQIRAKERADDVTTHRTDRESDRAFQSSEAEKGRALQRYLLGQRETGEAQVHWDKDADGNPRAYRVGKDGTVSPVQLPGSAPAGPSKADAFKNDLDTFSTAVFNHKGLPSAGAGLNLGRSYNTEFGNLKSAAAQLESVYLSDPEVRAKIAAMKPATDADVKRALKQAIGLDVEQMDAPTIQHEINRLRTKAGLKALGGPTQQAAAGADLGPDF